MNKNWITTFTKIAAVAIAFCVHLTACGPRSTATEGAGLPSTAAGRCAAAFFDAFNSGSDEVMRTFLEEYHSPSYLERYPLEERLAHYERLQGIFGQLTTLRIALSLELQLTLLADGADTDDVLVMRFQQEREPPHYLARITFSGIEHSEVPDEYVNYVATRAARIDDSVRESTIQSVVEALRDTYVYPELGQHMADALLRNHAEGRYDDVTKAGKLADMLTEDALTISNDRHIWVEAQNPMLQESTDPMNRPVKELRRRNYDFRKVEVFPGNIGYVKFDMIHDDDEAQDVAAAALAFMAHCEALIFDIRDNIGGESGTADLILGYLFPPGTVFGYFYDRSGRRVGESSIPAQIPGKPFNDQVPVYVLTSSRTGSAAEGFAYKLKHLGRGTIVGEVTRGMAHPSKEVVVNDYFRVSVPYWRSENVITGTDWEGTGVIPQIEVAADQALETAIEDALKQLGSRD